MVRWMMLVCLMLVGGVCVAPTAWGAPRAFEQRFSASDTGDIAVAANTLTTCPTAAPGCAAAQAGTAVPPSANNNNAYVMQYVQTDPSAPGDVFSSSGAELALPPGATVLGAYLYFGGDSNAGSGGAAPPDAAARNSVRWKVPGSSSYVPLVAAQLDFTTTDGSDFQGVVDVTAAVAAAGAGTYRVANVQAGTGADREAGWALVVAYRDSSQPPRDLTIFDGFQVVNSANPSVSIPVAGFQTPPTGSVRTELGFVAYEGDRGSTGDSARLNTTTLSDAANPANNFFNSSIARDGLNVTTKDPDFVNQFGFDASLVSADGVLANGDTSATIRLTTSGETYFPGVVTFATELFAPDVALVKDVDDLNGGQVEPGDVLRYTVTATNTGGDDATNVVLGDPVPAHTSIVPGSLRINAAASPGATFDAAANRTRFVLGTLTAGGGSATASFDVTVGTAPSGTVIRNAASATFVARTLGAPLTADSNPVTSTVAAADLTVTKTPTDFTATIGAPQTFTITVSNAGDAPTDGSPVTVDDPLPTGVFGDIVAINAGGWTCTPDPLPAAGPLSCQRSDVLAPGASYPPIELTADVVGAPLGDIVNTAMVDGGGDGDPSDNAATAIGQVSPHADVQLLKTVDRTTAATGERLTFTLRVRNAGPSAATDVMVDDPALASADFQDVSVSGAGCSALPCGLGTLAPGAERTVTAMATLAATGVPSVTNAAQASTTTADPEPANDTSAVTIAVAPTADLSIAKTLSPSPLDVTAPATFTLTVANDGPAAATNVVVTDALPDGFTATTVMPSQGVCSIDPVDHTLTCALGTIASGAGATVDLVGPLDAATAGTVLSNFASVRSDAVDRDPANDTAAASSIVIPAADLQLAKTVDNPTPAPGAAVTFSLALSNTGPSTALNARITDALPPGVTLVSAPGCTPAGATITCAAGDLVAGASRSFAITATVDPSLAGLTVTNTATATSDVDDPIPSNGTDITSIQVGAISPPPDGGGGGASSSGPPSPTDASPTSAPPPDRPAGAKDAPPIHHRPRAKVTVAPLGGVKTVRSGGTFTQRLRVRATTSTARRVRVCLRPAAGLSVAHAHGGRLVRGRVCWTVRRLERGASRTFRVTLRAATTTRTRVLASTVRVGAANARPSTARARARVLAGRVRPGGVTG